MGLLKEKQQMLRDHNQNIELRNHEIEKLKNDFQGKLKKQEEDGQRLGMKKVS